MEEAEFPEFKTYQRRLESFKDWPVSITTTKEELAGAGFLYLGHGDHTVCFYCGLGLKNFEVGDRAVEEHCKYSPTCPNLFEIASAEFIFRTYEKYIFKKNANKNPVSSLRDLAFEVYKDQKYAQFNMLCKICLVNRADRVYVPCGHLITCADCLEMCQVKKIEKCAMCRTDVQNVIQVYFC